MTEPYRVIVSNLLQDGVEDYHGSVSVAQLAAHLTDLYNQINELKWRVADLERQQQRLLNQHGNYSD